MIRVTDKNYRMDGYLKSALDVVNYNLGKDWDFVFTISGDGMVRVGKSVIAQQIAYYVAYNQKTKFDVDNIVFSGENLIDAAKSLPKNSVIVYDEARAELDSKKTMSLISKNLQDFFAECGMYNHFVILVLPDFFELNSTLALNRSHALINVFRVPKDKKISETESTIEYERGHFEFYSRDAKRWLYFEGKKNYNNYDVGKKVRNFFGEFDDFWIVDKEAYLKKKTEFLLRDRTNNKVKTKLIVEPYKLKAAIISLCEKMSHKEVSAILKKNGYEITSRQIGNIRCGVGAWGLEK